MTGLLINSYRYAAGGGGGSTFADTFTGDGDLAGRSLTTGTGTWVEYKLPTQKFITSGGLAALNPASVNSHILGVVDTALADCTVEIDFTYTSGAGGGGLCMRAADIDNCLFFTADGSGNAQLFKDVAASVTQVGSTLPGQFSNGVTYRLKAVLLGTSVKCYIDNVEVFNVTVADLASNTRHGIRTYNETSSRWDNFLVTS